eukprot:scpid49490/ scgid26160/ 
MAKLGACLYLLAGCITFVTCHSPESKLAILQGEDDEGFNAYRVEDGQLVQQTHGESAWGPVPRCPGGRIVSNPVAQSSDRFGLVFVLAENGQVYHGVDVGQGVSKWTQVSASVMLPRDDNGTADIDSLTVVRNNDTMLVFVKTIETQPRLYWSFANATSTKAAFSKWTLIKKGEALQSAAAAAVNYFTHYVEVVAIMTNGKVYHTWQTGVAEFHDWDEFGTAFWSHMPDPNAAPVLRANSGKSIFNGRLELFLYGKDGYIHHLKQTTCDRVMNPWSECTWGLYERLVDQVVPTPLVARSPLIAGSNAHGGIELFTVDKSFAFWHIYQIEEGKRFNTWSQIKAADAQFAPTIYQDQTGYWVGYLLDSGMKVHRVVEERTMKLTPAGTRLLSTTNITVSWTVPVDEATNNDWIGIYRAGDPNENYLDFAYVQGFQNPLPNPVPVGRIAHRSVLDDNVYEYRYMVNRKFVTVMHQSVRFYNYTTDDDGTQLYHGLAVGLGKEAGHFDNCVEDANHTLTAFRKAFVDFEYREIASGLKMLGVGLKDVATALAVCKDTDVAKKVMKFVMDLIACTDAKCEQFIIDIAGELISVLYENVHEIYGDIRGAKNCFPYKLYEQAGINIGRVVTASIEGPRA